MANPISGLLRSCGGGQHDESDCAPQMERNGNRDNSYKRGLPESCCYVN